MRPISCGVAALAQNAATTGDSGEPPTCSCEYVPDVSAPTSVAVPSCERHLEQSFVSVALGEEEHPAVVGRGGIVADRDVDVGGQHASLRERRPVQRTSRLAVYTYFFEAGCTFASKVEPSGVKSGDA